MWPWVRNIDWPVTIGTIGGLITIIGTVVLWIREARRRIICSAENVYFGPAMHANMFMGRNYPSEDRIGLECELSFFSNKSVATGLHKFQLEFCRQSYIGQVVEFEPDMTFVFKDLDKINTPGASHSLRTLDLASRQFVTMNLSKSFGRERWEALRSCAVVRLKCETPEGRKKRFRIGNIQFPTMPPAGVRGPEYCSIQIASTANFGRTPPPSYDGSAVISAVRRQKMLGPPGQMLPSAEDIRYWTGGGWSQSLTDAKVYNDLKDARDEGESMKIWNNVPQEWVNDERK